MVHAAGDELAGRVASAEGLGVNRHAPVALRVIGGVGDDGLDLPGQDAVDVMDAFSGDDQEPPTGGGWDGPLGSWPDGGVRRCPETGVLRDTPYKAWCSGRPVWCSTRVQGLDAGCKKSIGVRSKGESE